MSAQRQRAMATEASVPRLPRHVRLHYDKVRQAWALLSPEKILWPDETSLAILQHCDGKRELGEIAAVLAQEFEADISEVLPDVLEFAQDWSDRMVLRL